MLGAGGLRLLHPPQRLGPIPAQSGKPSASAAAACVFSSGVSAALLCGAAEPVGPTVVSPPRLAQPYPKRHRRARVPTRAHPAQRPSILRGQGSWSACPTVPKGGKAPPAGGICPSSESKKLVVSNSLLIRVEGAVLLPGSSPFPLGSSIQPGCCRGRRQLGSQCLMKERRRQG